MPYPPLCARRRAGVRRIVRRAAGAGEATDQPVALRRYEVALDRAAPRQPDRRGRRTPGPALHVLHGRGQWRGMEDDRRRPDVGADLRRPAERLDRVAGGRSVRSQRRLRRQRRGAAPARPVHGRRRLQVHRRRQDLDAPWPSRRPADSAHRRRPAVRGPGVRGRARPSVRPQRGARHLPLDRRRPHVPEGALQGREHGRQRRRHRPGQPRHRLRHDVGRAAGPVGERRVGGHGRRHLQVHRRRDDVEAADQRAAGGGAGQPRHLLLEPQAALRRGRLRERARQQREPRRDGHLPQRRRGRDVDAHHDRLATGRPDRRRRPADAAPGHEEPRPDRHGQHRVLVFD